MLPDIRQKKEIDHTILSIDNDILKIFLLSLLDMVNRMYASLQVVLFFIGAKCVASGTIPMRPDFILMIMH